MKPLNDLHAARSDSGTPFGSDSNAKQKPSSKAAKGSPGFKSGGSAYDPLNGKL